MFEYYILLKFLKGRSNVKKTALSFIFVSICVIPAENKVGKYQNSLGTPSFFGVIEERKLPVTSFCGMYPDVREALLTINTLTKINKRLTETIDDTTLFIIKDLSEKYNCSNEYIASGLCTKKANERIVLQKNLIACFGKLFPHSYTQRDEGDVKRTMLAVDLNFTYGEKKETPLMLAVSIPYSASPIDSVTVSVREYNFIMGLLLDYGADVCVRNGQGQNILMVLVQLPLLCAVGRLDRFCRYVKKNHACLNQQDYKGNTALHYCFVDVCDRYSFEQSRLYRDLEKLLNLGANPTIKNNSGETPLMLALKFGNPSVIDLLFNAKFKYLKRTKSMMPIANGQYKLDSHSRRKRTF